MQNDRKLFRFWRISFMLYDLVKSTCYLRQERCGGGWLIRWSEMVTLSLKISRSATPNSLRLSWNTVTPYRVHLSVGIKACINWNVYASEGNSTTEERQVVFEADPNLGYLEHTILHSSEWSCHMVCPSYRLKRVRQTKRILCRKLVAYPRFESRLEI